MKVRWWGDEKGGTITGTQILNEDWVYDDEYISPRSIVEEVNQDIPEEDREEIIVSLVKGTPMLVDESEEIPKKNFKFKSGRK